MVGIQERWVASAGDSLPAESVAEVEEAALLRAGRAGDTIALEQLLALHKRALHALCYGILGHAEDAEDAVQETFLRALRALCRFREDAAFRTWLFRIAVNVCLKWKGARPSTLPWNEGSPSMPTAASPESVALRHLEVIDALNRLPPRRRAILLLKELEGWSVAEIARALDCRPKQVEYELYQARRALAAWQRRVTGEGGKG